MYSEDKENAGGTVEGGGKGKRAGAAGAGARAALAVR